MLSAMPSVRTLLAGLALGAAAGAAATYAFTAHRGTPTIVRGEVRAVSADSPTADVQAIAFRFDGRTYATPGEGESVPVVADVPWTDAAGAHHGGDRPACLVTGQRVELAVLDVRGQGEWAPNLVVWVHCLT
jgi:hypothetical protein